jgi:hypothetical protein
MTDERRYTACCGLYCTDCIPSRETLFDTARALADDLDRLDFGRYAAIRSSRDDSLGDYEGFRRYLSALTALRCPGPCAEGGGKKECAIRDCAGNKGYTGCWDCNTFETCGLLEPFMPFHGDTPRNNLRLIREHGPDNWAQRRGPHYLWTSRP